MNYSGILVDFSWSSFLVRKLAYLTVYDRGRIIIIINFGNQQILYEIIQQR